MEVTDFYNNVNTVMGFQEKEQVFQLDKSLVFNLEAVPSSAEPGILPKPLEPECDLNTKDIPVNNLIDTVISVDDEFIALEQNRQNKIRLLNVILKPKQIKEPEIMDFVYDIFDNTGTPLKIELGKFLIKKGISMETASTMDSVILKGYNNLYGTSHTDVNKILRDFLEFHYDIYITDEVFEKYINYPLAKLLKLKLRYRYTAITDADILIKSDEELIEYINMFSLQEKDTPLIAELYNTNKFNAEEAAQYVNNTVNFYYYLMLKKDNKYLPMDFNTVIMNGTVEAYALSLLSDVDPVKHRLLQLPFYNSVSSIIDNIDYTILDKYINDLRSESYLEKIINVLAKDETLDSVLEFILFSGKSDSFSKEHLDDIDFLHSLKEGKSSIDYVIAKLDERFHLLINKEALNNKQKIILNKLMGGTSSIEDCLLFLIAAERENEFIDFIELSKTSIKEFHTSLLDFIKYKTSSNAETDSFFGITIQLQYNNNSTVFNTFEFASYPELYIELFNRYLTTSRTIKFVKLNNLGYSIQFGNTCNSNNTIKEIKPYKCSFENWYHSIHSNSNKKYLFKDILYWNVEVCRSLISCGKEQQKVLNYIVENNITTLYNTDLVLDYLYKELHSISALTENNFVDKIKLLQFIMFLPNTFYKTFGFFRFLVKRFKTSVYIDTTATEIPDGTVKSAIVTNGSVYEYESLEQLISDFDKIINILQLSKKAGDLKYTGKKIVLKL